MQVPVRREPDQFWRKAQRAERRRRRYHPIPPPLPPGALVDVPGRGEMFVRYQAGPPGAPTVLLLHGWMASADLNWLGCWEALADRYHVLAVDHRGHGRGIRSIEPVTLTDCADDAAALLRELRVGPVIAVGYSMGGPIGLLLARNYPAQVRGLVPVATAAEMGRSGLDRGMAIAPPLLGALFSIGVPGLLLKRLAPVLADRGREDAPWLAGEMKRLHPADLAAAGADLSRFDARPWLSELSLPCASIVTTRDAAVRPAKQRALASALSAEVFDLDAGHTACITGCDEFAPLVRRAVDSVADRRVVAAPSGVGRLARLLERTGVAV